MSLRKLVEVSLRAPTGRSNLLSLFFIISLFLTALAHADRPWIKQQSPVFSANYSWYKSAMSGNGNYLALLPQINFIYISTNGGVSWSSYQVGIQILRALAISNDGSHMLVGGYYFSGRLFLSVNGGIT
ncbi:MAG: hypothetical protein HQL14_02765 [Candidatus Omnitrophica bacterium]|nr:hypothetical protein [Candidatus Omnitrophota bacterium]